MHPHKLSHRDVVRILVALLILSFAVEAGIAWHLFHGRDVMAGSLVLTAWAREAFAKLIERIAESFA